ncbi:MAG: EamA family transporter [Candidatus Wallbacteria bacterium]|nr:EamA family transporter [Candidatus Wallbacteria bacterium]
MFKIEDWLFYGILAFLTWGLWGFFPKLATRHLDQNSIIIWEIVGSLALGLYVMHTINYRPVFHKAGVIYSIITGISGMLGMYFFLRAMRSGGKASVLVTMTALYPIVSILLAVLILKEKLTLAQIAGMFFALIAVVLFTL